MMPVSNWNDADTALAQQIWDQYQQRHDLSGRKGQTAGINPASGEVWFGESIEDIVIQLDTTGVSTPLYYVRVGFDSYLRKGGRG